MIERLLERGNASGRADDNAESITKRLRTFRDSNQAVESHLRQKGPFKTVSAPLSLEQILSNTVATH
jgi:UMP-CMP kinase